MNDPPRVAFVIGSCALGGAEGQALLLARELREAGWPVRVFVLRMEGPRLANAKQLGAVDLQLPKIRPRNAVALVQCWLRTRRALREFRPDVVHAWLFEAEAWAWSVLPRGGALVTSRRAPALWTARRRWQPAVQSLVTRRSARVVANSPSIAREALREETALRRRQLRVIPNGVDFAALDSVPARPADLPPRFLAAKTRAVFVGNLRPGKGHVRLVRLWARVVEQSPGAQLLLVGRDEGEANIVRRAIEKYKLARSVHWIGAHASPSALMKCCDMYVSASEGEGMPNAMLEAMACGLPVVALDASGVREAVGNAGVVVGTEDAFVDSVVDLSTYETKRRQLGARGRRRVERRFSVESFVEAHMRLYREASE